MVTFTVPVKLIAAPLTQVAGVCNKRPSNPADLTKNVKLDVTKDALSLTGRDGDVQLTATLPFTKDNGASCEQEGTFLVDALKLSSFIKTLSPAETITFTLRDDNDNRLAITTSTGTSDFVLQAAVLKDGETFPAFTDTEGAKPVSFAIEEHKLRYILDKSAFCVSVENYREYLKGVRFEATGNELKVYALDGHRMAALETVLATAVDGESGEAKFLTTLRGTTELLKLLSNTRKEPITLTVGNSVLTTQVGMYALSMRLLVVKYPNVAAVLPKQVTEVSIPASELKDAVNRVALFSDKRLSRVSLSFENNQLTLQAQNSDRETARAVIDNIDFAPSKPVEVNLNADYVKAFLQNIATPEVVFGITPENNNTQIAERNQWADIGVRLRYVVSHIMV